jgi:phosphinothricin acetyltransferase
MGMQYRIRKVTDGDREAVVAIFNYFVERSYAAYPEKKVNLDFFDKLRQLATGYPFYVIESPREGTVGFGLMRPYLSYDTFRHSAELTYFILPEHTRKGLGLKLLRMLTKEGKALGIDNLLVHMSSRNKASIDFHRKQGFHECGRFRKIGRKFGKDFDVLWMQLTINE